MNNLLIETLIKPSVKIVICCCLANTAMAHHDGNYTFDKYPDHIRITNYINSGSGNVVIPPSFENRPVTRIEANAFDNSTVITSITIPSSVTTIGNGAFQGSSNLGKVFFLGDAPTLGANVFGGTAGNFTIYYIQGKAGFTSPSWNGYSAVAITEPLVIAQPSSATTNSGGAVNFSVLSIGPSLAFQWYMGNSGDTSSPVSGATSSTYQVGNIKTSSNYWVRISNSAGSVDSSTVIVTVTGPDIDVSEPTGSSLVSGKAKRSFGTRKVGQAGKSRTFTITNKGNKNLSGLTVSVGGLHGQDFIVTPPARVVLAPGKSTKFKIRFNPTASGTRNASIYVKSNDVDEKTLEIKVAGFGAS